MKLLLTFATGFVAGVLVSVAVIYFALSPSKSAIALLGGVEEMPGMKTNDQTVEIPSGKMFQVISPDGIALIDFTKFEPDAATYRWRFRPSKGMEEQSGTGRVFERYARNQAKSGEYQLRDQGSDTTVRAGSISLQWSYGSESSAWIYPEGTEVSLHDNNNFDSFDMATKQ